MRIINCWNNLRAEVVSLSLENIAVLCCEMCCSLMMAFGFKMGDNRDSVRMEGEKIIALMLAYCLCSLSSLICRLCIFFFQNYWQKQKFPSVISLYFKILFCDIHSIYTNLDKQLFEKELVKSVKQFSCQTVLRRPNWREDSIPGVLSSNWLNLFTVKCKTLQV